MPVSADVPVSVSTVAALLSDAGHRAAVPVHPGAFAAMAVLLHPGMMLGLMFMLHNMGYLPLPYIEVHLDVGSLGLSTQYKAGHTGQHGEFSEVFLHGLFLGNGKN